MKRSLSDSKNPHPSRSIEMKKIRNAADCPILVSRVFNQDIDINEMNQKEFQAKEFIHNYNIISIW